MDRTPPPVAWEVDKGKIIAGPNGVGVPFINPHAHYPNAKGPNEA